MPLGRLAPGMGSGPPNLYDRKLWVNILHYACVEFISTDPGVRCILNVNLQNRTKGFIMDREVTEVEVLFDGMIVKLITDEPVAFFRMVKALENDGRKPQIRLYDAELEDMTCWQPLKDAA